MSAKVDRPLKGRLEIDMAYARDNRAFLREACGGLIRPEWNGPRRRWLVARPHLQCVVQALALRFGSVTVQAEFSTAMQCDTRCRGAQGDDCTCSCLGENHQGMATWYRWQQVGDTTLIGTDPVHPITRRTWIARAEDFRRA